MPLLETFSNKTYNIWIEEIVRNDYKYRDFREKEIYKTNLVVNIAGNDFQFQKWPWKEVSRSQTLQFLKSNLRQKRLKIHSNGDKDENVLKSSPAVIREKQQLTMTPTGWNEFMQ